MYHVAHDGTDPVPLDFNTPPRTDSVADALVTDPDLAERPRAPAPETLLAEIGLPAHVSRQVVAARSAPSV